MSGVRDNTRQHRFELDVDGHTAFVVYRREPGTITFVHTEVPKELGGRGIGSRLAKGALDIVRGEGLQVVAQCPFIARYIARHPEYQNLLKSHRGRIRRLSRRARRPGRNSGRRTRPAENAGRR